MTDMALDCRTAAELIVRALDEATHYSDRPDIGERVDDLRHRMGGLFAEFSQGREMHEAAFLARVELVAQVIEAANRRLAALDRFCVALQRREKARAAYALVQDEGTRGRDPIWTRVRNDEDFADRLNAAYREKNEAEVEFAARFVDVAALDGPNAPTLEEARQTFARS